MGRTTFAKSRHFGNFYYKENNSPLIACLQMNNYYLLLHHKLKEARIFFKYWQHQSA